MPCHCPYTTASHFDIPRASGRQSQYTPMQTGAPCHWQVLCLDSLALYCPQPWMLLLVWDLLAKLWNQ